MKTEKDTGPTKKIYELENNAMKWFTDNTLKMTEMYTKQINQSFETFNKFFSTGFPLGKTGWMPNETVSEVLKKNTEMFLHNLKTFSEKSEETINNTISTFTDFNKKNDFSEGGIKNIVNTYEDQILQMIDYNKQLFETLEKELHSKHFDIDALIEKSAKKMKQDFETSRDAVKKFIETYSTKTDFSPSANKKLVEEINKQIEHLVESNKEFWTNTINYFEEKKEEKKGEEKGERKKHIIKHAKTPLKASVKRTYIKRAYATKKRA